jgi:hypothetical protein
VSDGKVWTSWREFMKDNFPDNCPWCEHPKGAHGGDGCGKMMPVETLNGWVLRPCDCEEHKRDRT